MIKSKHIYDCRSKSPKWKPTPVVPIPPNSIVGGGSEGDDNGDNGSGGDGKGNTKNHRQH